MMKQSGNGMPMPSFTMEGLLKGLEEHPSIPPSAKIPDSIISCYTQMKREQQHVMPWYKPGGEWDVYLTARKSLYESIMSGRRDEACSILHAFWRNELGAIVKQYASYEALKSNEEKRIEFLEKMNIDLLVWSELSSNPHVSDLQVPNVGNSWGIMHEDTLIVPKAMRYKLLAEQIANISDDVTHPVVAEIGAGYAGMAYYLTRDVQCAYFDFDLPESLVLAAYYHLCASPHKKIYLYQGEGIPPFNELCTDYDLVFLPNWYIEKLPERSVSLFVNTFSFSEMPLPVIENYLSIITKLCKGYFFHNNMDRSGVFQHGFERVKASDYPISSRYFQLIFKKFDSFQVKKRGRDGDYSEFLYKCGNKGCDT